jgi:hypothetical protein
MRPIDVDDPAILSTCFQSARWQVPLGTLRADGKTTASCDEETPLRFQVPDSEITKVRGPSHL